MTYYPPSHDCPLCPRLVRFRNENRLKYPSFFNGPVPSFGTLDAQLLVVGLAPGLKGANQTGRPFTGDYAGIILYSSLRKYGFAEGEYNPEEVKNGTGDDFKLINCRITNAVRCVPQENKPENQEIKTCNQFLAAEMKAMLKLRVVLTLGSIAHKAVIMAEGLKQSAYKFGHGARHDLKNITMINSYHCSRYNINTGVLTQAMFDDVVGQAKDFI